MPSLKPLLAAASAVAVSSGFAAAQAPAAGPFDAPSTLPFQAPPFDKIKESDYSPGYEEGMRRELAEMRQIADNPAPPTFDNTIVAMERTGQMLNRVNAAFDAVNGADTDDALQKIETDEAPKLAAHHDAIYLDAKLFARVKSIYDRRDQLHLSPEALQLVKIDYQQFVRSGANLPEADKAKLKALNTQLSTLSTAFGQKLLAAAKAGALVVDDPARLKGLSDAEIAAAAAAAKARGLTGKWVVPLQNTTQQPSLASLEDRSVREALYNAGWTRAEKGDGNDTRETIATVARLRAEKARLLGFPTWAAYVLQNQMAETPQAVDQFLGGLNGPTRMAAEAEVGQLQDQIAKDGQSFQLQPWDWNRYAEKLRKQSFDLDEKQIKPYFELHNVLENGVFYAANQLYGISFKRRTDIPVWNADVMVYEVSDKDGSPLGMIYFDYFKRDNKNGGAWMSSFVRQSRLLGNKPVVYNVANLPKPAPGQPALISFDDVTTMFHEFGHALHGLFASGEYPTLSGTAVARDFVEFPSQFNEHWALYPEVLAHYARHYQTGAPMPPELVAKIRKAATFNQAYALGELLAAAELDMRWHELSADAPKEDVDAFEAQALKASGADFPGVPPRYRSSYFLHIWSNGYAAGYYAYLWTEMLDDDAYHWFTQHGGLTRANGQRFRDLILSRGHSLDYGPMFKAFYGKDPEIGPMLVHRGLQPGEE
jgi:peptidyl-dipeptidase Dcp